MPAIGASGPMAAPPRSGPAAPAPKSVAIPTKTTTGNNPRGVAIAAPVRPTTNDIAARTLSTGNNPRGVAITQRPTGGQTLANVRQLENNQAANALALAATPPKPSQLSDSQMMEAALKAGKLPGAIVPVLGRLGQEVMGAPKALLEGGTALATAAVHDLAHGQLNEFMSPATSFGGGQGQVSQMIGKAVANDPIVQSIKQGSLAPIGHDPLGAALDVTGLYGTAGRLVGTASDMARGISSTAATASPMAEGLPNAIRVSRPSPNLFTRAAGRAVAPATQAVKNAPGVDRIVQAVQESRMRKAVASQHAAERGVRDASEQRIIKGLREVKPSGKSEKNVALMTTGFGFDRAGLQGVRNDIQASLDQHAKSVASVESGNGVLPGHLTPQGLKNAQTNLAAIDRAIANPALDTASLDRVASQAHALQEPLSQQKVQYGALDAQKAEDAMARRAALAHVPGAQVIAKGDKVPHPDWLAELRAATARANTARAARDEAATNGTALVARHQQAIKDLTDQIKRTPLHPATDQLVTRQLLLREHLRGLLPQVKADTAAELKARQEDLKAANQDLSKTQSSKRYLQGTVVPDPTANPILHGSLKGQRFRNVDALDVQHVFEQHPNLTYVHMGTADEPRVGSLQGFLNRPHNPVMTSQPQAEFTGRSLEAGTQTPGWRGLTRSLLRDNRIVSDARERHNFLNTWSINGQHYPDRATADSVAANWEAQTGHRAIPFQDGEVWHVVPHAAADELHKQMRLDHPENPLLRGYLAGSRQFRNTVLAYSPKLPVMHSVENVTRTALNEKGTSVSPIVPLLKAANDIRGGLAIERSTKNLFGNDSLAALRESNLPGAQVRQSSSANWEDLGRAGRDIGPARQVLRTTIDGYNKAAQTLIRAQRSLAKPAELAALGKQGRAMLHDTGMSVLKAHTSVTKYADELARGLDNPAMRDLAMRDMHKALGQYNSYTARYRQVFRLMPFAPWYLNAVKLVYHGLPARAGVTNALIHDVSTSNQQAWDAQHQGLQKAPDLQSALAEGHGNYLDVGKFLPIGVQQAPWKTLASLVAPQVQSIGAPLLGGLDPFYNPLRSPTQGSSYQQPYAQAGIFGLNPLHAVLSAAEAGAAELGGPASDIARALQGQGKTLYTASTPVLHMLSGGTIGHVWPHNQTTPGPLGGILGHSWDKVIDPFAPTHYGSGSTVIGPGLPHNGGGLPGSGGGLPTNVGGLPKPASYHVIPGGQPGTSLVLHRPITDEQAAGQAQERAGAQRNERLNRALAGLGSKIV